MPKNFTTPRRIQPRLHCAALHFPTTTVLRCSAPVVHNTATYHAVLFCTTKAAWPSEVPKHKTHATMHTLLLLPARGRRQICRSTKTWHSSGSPEQQHDVHLSRHEDNAMSSHALQCRIILPPSISSSTCETTLNNTAPVCTMLYYKAWVDGDTVLTNPDIQTPRQPTDSRYR